MTIKYDGRIINYDKTIPARGAFLGALLGGPRTNSIRIEPGETDAQDEVTFRASYGSITYRGREINDSRRCRDAKITWSGSKERI